MPSTASPSTNGTSSSPSAVTTEPTNTTATAAAAPEPTSTPRRHRPSRLHTRLTSLPFLLSTLNALLVLIIFCLSASAIARTLRLDSSSTSVHWSVLYTITLSVLGSVFFTVQAAYADNYAVYSREFAIGFLVVWCFNCASTVAWIVAVVGSHRRDYSPGAFYSRLAMEIIVAVASAILAVSGGVRTYFLKRPVVRRDIELGGEQEEGVREGGRGGGSSRRSTRRRGEEERIREVTEGFEGRRRERGRQPYGARAARDSLIRIHNNLNSPVGSTRREGGRHG